MPDDPAPVVLTEHAKAQCVARGLRELDVLRVVEDPFAVRENPGGATLYVGQGLIRGRRWGWVGAVVRGRWVVTAYDADAKNGMRPAP